MLDGRRELMKIDRLANVTVDTQIITRGDILPPLWMR